MRLDGETRLIPIVGDPIAQVKSPALLTEQLAGRGLNAIVPPAHVAPADFDGFVATMKRTQNVDGLVLTVITESVDGFRGSKLGATHAFNKVPAAAISGGL